MMTIEVVTISLLFLNIISFWFGFAQGIKLERQDRKLDELDRQKCEWTGRYKRYQEITGDILFRVTKTSCSDSHDDIVSVVDFTYCPNCGKRIKYVEE